jgi:hypothetical protein
MVIGTSCQKELSSDSAATAYISIRFHPEINGTPFRLNETFTNSFGESYSATIFKFYFGQIALSGNPQHSQAVNGDPYYLVDLADPSSLEINTTIKPGTYNAISVLLGVDSARNVSGVQSGALDPAKGMFWTWNTGYIYTKLEGTSPSSTQVNGKFEYHIGGFRWPYSAIRNFTVTLTDTDTWQLQEGKTLELDISVDMDAFFNYSYPVRISEEPVCMTPGELAYRISGNFAGAFQLTQFDIN